MWRRAMRKSPVSYLQRRNGPYHFRMRIPMAFRSALGRADAGVAHHDRLLLYRMRRELVSSTSDPVGVWVVVEDRSMR